MSGVLKLRPMIVSFWGPLAGSDFVRAGGICCSQCIRVSVTRETDDRDLYPARVFSSALRPSNAAANRTPPRKGGEVARPRGGPGAVRSAQRLCHGRRLARPHLQSMGHLCGVSRAGVLTRGSTCREAVRRVQAWRAASKRSIPDDSTSAYCQARCRRKCGIDEIEDVFDAHGRIEELRFRERRRGRESPTGRRPRL